MSKPTRAGRLPFTITVHDIIDREAGLIGPGRLVASSGTLEAARKRIGEHWILSGDLFKGPSNVVHIVDSRSGEDHGWWFKAPFERSNGKYITMSLSPVRHEGGPLTVREPETAP